MNILYEIHSACFMNEAHWTNCNSTLHSLGFIHVVLYIVFTLNCFLKLYYQSLMASYNVLTKTLYKDNTKGFILHSVYLVYCESCYFPSWKCSRDKNVKTSQDDPCVYIMGVSSSIASLIPLKRLAGLLMKDSVFLIHQDNRCLVYAYWA